MRNTLKKEFLKAAISVVAGGAAAGIAVLAFPAAPLLIAGAALAPGGAAAAYTVGERLSEKFWHVDGRLPEGVPLTAGEIAFAKSIFGKSFSDGDLRRVKKYFVPPKKGNNRLGAYVCGPRRISFYGARRHEADFSQTKNISNFGLFIHEMTHIWQEQRLLPEHVQRFRKPKGYDYTLSTTSRFTDFGGEQQASIIEDYARRFIFPGGALARRISNTPENDALLQKVVEDKFPEARKTRLSLTAQKRAFLTPKA